MNILPKKRWHVRTKENIARVRKDEAEAAEQERQERLRIENADREARIKVLKEKSKQKLIELDIQPQPTETLTKAPEHINLFSNLDRAVQTTNKDHDKELKDKKEDYEKKIGYLTYLGQDTNEALGKKNWYDLPPESSQFSHSGLVKDTYNKVILKDEYGKPKKKELDEKDGEVAWKAKQCQDPLNKFKKYCSQYKSQSYNTCVSKNNEHSLNSYDLEDNKQNKNKKSKQKDNDKNEAKLKLQKLREARLKREQQEKCRTEILLSKLSGTASAASDDDNKAKKLKPKYNSQFNPELARQNYR